MFCIIKMLVIQPVILLTKSEKSNYICNDQELTKNHKQMNSFSMIRPYHVYELFLKFIGIVFVVSSIFKWIGLRSFSVTINEFCGLLGYDLFYGHGMILAVVICTMELLLGLMAFIPRINKYVVWVYLLVMCYFTYITYINVVSLYGQIESCGCFGEVVHLTPQETLAKNVVLLCLAITACALSLYKNNKLKIAR